MMEKAMQKEETKQQNGDGKTAPAQPESLTRFTDLFFKETSFWHSILKFVTHPFLLLSGFALTIYFFYKAGQSKGASQVTEKLREENEELRAQLKTLKLERKALKNELGLLSRGDRDIQRRAERKELPTGVKKIGVARLD